MKKFASAFCFLLLCCVIGQAQVRLIPKIGWHNYYVTEERTIDMDGQKGLHGGADIRFGSGTYLQPGVFYYTYNVDLRSVVEGAVDPRFEELDFQSLRVPLVLGTSFLEIEGFAMRAQIGGVATIPLEVKSNTFNLQKEDLEKVAFAGTLGFGLDIGRFTFDIDYDFGLTDTWVKRTVNVQNTDLSLAGKSNMLSFSIGYMIGRR